MSQWIKHTPGDHQPIEDFIWVKTKHKTGDIVGPYLAKDLYWGKKDNPISAEYEEIISYCIVDEPEIISNIAMNIIDQLGYACLLEGPNQTIEIPEIIACEIQKALKLRWNNNS